MPRFHMNTLEPSEDRYALAAEAYEATAQFDRDAIAHILEVDELPAVIVALARELYRESTQFATVVSDALDGECAWS